MKYSGTQRIGRGNAVISIGVLCALVLTPSIGIGQDTLRSDVLGCYRILLGEWVPRSPHALRFQVPPDTFRLLAERGTTPMLQEFPTARPLLGPEEELSSAGWHSIHPDSIRVIWTNGFVGVVLQLQVAADSLSGQAVAFSDAIDVDSPGWPTSSVVARRIACPIREVQMGSREPLFIGNRGIREGNGEVGACDNVQTAPRANDVCTQVELSTSLNTLGVTPRSLRSLARQLGPEAAWGGAGNLLRRPAVGSGGS